MFAVVLILLSMSACKQPQGLKPYEGDVVPPALQLMDIHGRPHNLMQYRGRVVLVNFWATWCPPCRAEMPSLWRLKAKLKNHPFDILAVNIEEDAAMVKAYLPQAMKQDLVVLLDRRGQTNKDWGLMMYPTTYIIDKQGRIRYVVTGERQWDHADIVAQINQLAQE